MAMFAVLQRLWFWRVWIVQKAVFTQRLILVCGAVMFRWEALQEVLLFMAKNKLDETLGNLVRSLMFGGLSGRFTRKLQLAGVLVTGFATPQAQASPRRFRVDPKASYTFATSVKRIKRNLGFPELQISLNDETSSQGDEGSKPDDDPEVKNSLGVTDDNTLINGESSTERLIVRLLDGENRLKKSSSSPADFFDSRQIQSGSS